MISHYKCLDEVLQATHLNQDLLKLHPSKRGRLLGLSVGTDAVFARCVGVAVSDSNNEVASPVSVMERKKDNIYQMASALEDLNYLNEMKHTMTEQAHEHHSHLEGR
ncbi:polynucleotidyl transferase, ribonuclease H-like superfamily protein [Artemisia annua]|uniref:Polynucleotidyl transferase, ribonuclease H-like superfamily protein n=1 Tax=Artemisia annua TaxID=35608 RepID=A0A2U1PPP2_ARTAN|nr:polynucleotidyl transferase, ribonuclease H-like superfamily protein [Artemisia annua]